MFETIAIKTLQFIEEAKQSGVRNAFGKSFFTNAEIVPVVKELENAQLSIEVLNKQNIILVELTRNDLAHFNYSYRFKSRSLKAKRNVKKGFKAFALVSNNVVIGDIWYITWESTRHPHLHDDIELLFLNPGEKDVYMFDMFLDPLQRGNNIALLLMKNALHKLAEKGYKKIFGFFEAKNIPALWVHRSLKFKELDRVFFSRYFLKRSSRKIGNI
jgi:Acetyltransferase (GNAT) family.